MGYYIYLSVRNNEGDSYRNYSGERFATPEYKNSAYGFHKKAGVYYSVRVYSCQNPPIYMLSSSKDIVFTCVELGEEQYQLFFENDGDADIIFSEVNPYGEEALRYKQLYPDRKPEYVHLNPDESEVVRKIPPGYHYNLEKLADPHRCLIFGPHRFEQSDFNDDPTSVASYHLMV